MKRRDAWESVWDAINERIPASDTEAFLSPAAPLSLAPRCSVLTSIEFRIKLLSGESCLSLLLMPSYIGIIAAYLLHIMSLVSGGCFGGSAAGGFTPSNGRQRPKDQGTRAKDETVEDGRRNCKMNV